MTYQHIPVQWCLEHHGVLPEGAEYGYWRDGSPLCDMGRGEGTPCRYTQAFIAEQQP